jgi:hypothetical protein
MDKDVLIDWMAQKILPTDLWKDKLPIKTRNLALGFSDQELFDEDPKLFHCIEVSMAKVMQMKNRENPEEWAVKIRKNLNSSGQVHLPRKGQGTLKDSFMRIAKTHPSVFKDNIVNQSKLTRSSMTALWAAIYTTLGGVWWNPQQLESDPPTDDGFSVVQHTHQSLLKSSLKKASFPPEAKKPNPSYAPKVTAKPKLTPAHRKAAKPAQASNKASGCFFEKETSHNC